MACCNNLPKNSIMLIQGDDSNALGHYIKIKITSELDMSEWYAILQLERFQWKYTDLTSGEIEWVVTRDITAQLSIGEHQASIKIFDQNDRCKTVIQNIQVYVGAQTVANPEPEPEPEENPNSEE